MNEFEQLGRQVGEIETAIDLWIAKLGLTYNHFAVLYSLFGAENGQCTQKMICDEWLLPKQTVFNICKEYKEKAWIEFGESQTDKREKIIRLTATGKQQAEPVWQATQALSEKTFTLFGKKKTAQLFALMSELGTIYRQQVDLWA